MRLTTPKTLLAIAIGIAAATGATAAWCGSDGPRGDNAGCPDKHLARIAERLQLTPEQQAQVKTIIEDEHTAAKRLHDDTRKRIDGVLTDAQRAEQNAAMQQRIGKQVDRLAKRLDLTAEQITQVRTIVEEQRGNPGLDRTAVKERIAAVLTPEQRDQFESKGSRDEHHGKKDCGPGHDEPGGGSDDDSADESDDDSDDGPDQG